MTKRIIIGWEKAILEIFEQNNGIVTLHDLYKKVPILIGESISLDFNHTIRAYLRRLKSSKGLIKQIGLSTYALAETRYNNHFYEEIKSNEINYNYFINLPKNKIHGFIEGMLIEIGIFNNYDTYTPDKNVIFNGKRLTDLVRYSCLPDFSYKEILDKVKQIDVIWFKDGFPIKTFDVENSTDFTKAFLRAYQLKSFKTQFYVIASEDKINIYEDRRKIKPFNEIKNDMSFISFDKIFAEYKDAVIHNNIRIKSILLN
ncbi:MAG: hypothetical protein A2W77_09675 [Nitrospinae bacterium RIFCSPLOWO2_12_39_16]|nr:MAG: hypothetical protein A2W77_09675 [Nitrospinae bacterium RIFCSPLOWO2_12_39_16]